MSCLPGMPCYGPLVKIVYPKGCDPFANRIVDSNFVEYSGNNLSCTGIQTCDSLTVALEKIDNKICSDQFVAQIIQTIANDDVLKAYFCQLVNSCISTTTTTTTIPIFQFTVWLLNDGELVCNNQSTIVYSLDPELITGSFVYTNLSLTNPVTDGLKLWKPRVGFPNEYVGSTIYNNGQIYSFNGFQNCNSTTTTSSSTSTSTTTTTTTLV